MKTYKAASIAAVLIVAVVAPADQSDAQPGILRYRLAGDWTQVTDGESPGWGENPNNDGSPGSSVPGPTDEARVNFGGATVEVTSAVPTFNRLLIGVDESGTVEVRNEGVLTSNEDIVVGNNGFVEANLIVEDGATVNVGRILWVARGPVVGDTLGILNIDSGAVVNVASHLWWGSTGEAIVNISGTLNQTGGILGLGSADFNTFGGTATVNVMDGGEFNLSNIHAGGTQLSIQPGSKIDITGSGQVTLPGDFVEVLEGYRDADLLFGNGVAGAVSINTVSGVIDGDFNLDGLVDAIDYTVWRDNFGENSAVLNGNGSGAATVVEADYDLWKSNFGSAAELTTIVTASALLTSGSTSVPEPSSLLLAGALAALAGFRIRRR